MEYSLGLSGGTTTVFLITLALGIGGIAALIAALLMPRRWHLPYRAEVFFVLLLVALGLYGDYQSTTTYQAYEKVLPTHAETFEPTATSDSVRGEFDRQIRVYAFQWGFIFFDEAGRASRNAVKVGPNQRVLFNLMSNDVIHGFNIPATRITTEFDPGEIRSIWIRTPPEPGKYLIQCLNYCGLGHSQMKAWLVVAESDPEEDHHSGEAAEAHG